MTHDVLITPDTQQLDNAHTRITPARSPRTPTPGDIPTVVVPTSTRLADKPRHHPPPHGPTTATLLDTSTGVIDSSET
jgi:hypothetical protein